MKLKDILEESLTSNIPNISKKLEGWNEKSLRAFLKEIGCVQNRGQKGWRYEGDSPEILEQSIDELRPKELNQRTNERRNERTKEQTKKTTNEQNNQPTNKQNNQRLKEQINEPTNERKNEEIQRKRASFDIDIKLLKELKMFALVEEKNVYEIVEQAIREHLSGK